MTVSQTTPSVIEIISAPPDQEPILANLLELYCYDFSEFLDLTLGPNGRYGYEQLPLYWTESNRHPFLILVDGRVAGFALVRRGSQISGDESTWDLAEFFVLRSYRRLGIGTKAAYDVWKKFPGKWEVRFMDRNAKAKTFWRQAIDGFMGKPIEPISFVKNGEGWRLISFNSEDVATTDSSGAQ